jgi:Uma2 family endonuclease
MTGAERADIWYKELRIRPHWSDSLIHGDRTMSTIVQPMTSPASGRMTVDEFERIAEDLDGPFDLIDGQLIRKPNMDPPHVWSTERLRKRLERMLPEGWSVRDDKPLRIPDFNDRRPDIAVVRGDEDTYETRHPEPADVMLLMEVSMSTLSRDQGKKRLLYTSSNIPIYWTVNATDRRRRRGQENSSDRTD